MSSGAVIAYIVIITKEIDQSAAIRLLQERVNSGAFTKVRSVLSIPGSFSLKPSFKYSFNLASKPS